MKKPIYCFLLFIAMTFTNMVYGQMNKKTCEEILKGIDLASFQRIRINYSSDPGSSGASHGSTSQAFEAALVFMSFEEEYLLMKEGNETVLYIPYQSIKLIRTSPKKGSDYATVLIQLMD